VGGTEFIISFEGSQALPVFPSGKCKLLTGTIKVCYFFLFIYFVGVGGVNGLRLAKILKLPLGGLHVKHTEQRGIWNWYPNSTLLCMMIMIVMNFINYTFRNKTHRNISCSEANTEISRKTVYSVLIILESQLHGWNIVSPVAISLLAAFNVQLLFLWQRWLHCINECNRRNDVHVA
jgi:hypothetical protein